MVLRSCCVGLFFWAATALRGSVPLHASRTRARGGRRVEQPWAATIEDASSLTQQQVADEVPQNGSPKDDEAPTLETATTEAQWFSRACAAARPAPRWEREGEDPIAAARVAGRAALRDGADLLPRRSAEAWRFTDLDVIWQTAPEDVVDDDDAPDSESEEKKNAELDASFRPPPTSSTTSSSDVDSQPNNNKPVVSLVVRDGVVSRDETTTTTTESSSSGALFYAGSIRDAPDDVARRFFPTLVEEPPEVALERSAPNAALGSAPWAALNAACLSDAVLIVLDGDSSSEAAVHVTYVSDDANAPAIAHPRLCVDVSGSASLELFQTFFHGGGEEDSASPRVCNSRTTMRVAPEASATHAYAVVSKLDGDKETKWYHHESSTIECEGTYTGKAIASTRCRLGLDVGLTRQGASARLDCLALASKRADDVDFRTQIRHAVSDATSAQDVRLVAGGTEFPGKKRNGASVRFKGRIDVPREAQRTDAEQLCRSAILSDSAEVNVMPSLEIVADDVKCSHGATVADLDDESLFFLLSRGVPRPLAKTLLVRGFCDSLVDDVKPNFPAALNRALDAKVTALGAAF